MFATLSVCKKSIFPIVAARLLHTRALYYIYLFLEYPFHTRVLSKPCFIDLRFYLVILQTKKRLHVESWCIITLPFTNFCIYEKLLIKWTTIYLKIFHMQVPIILLYKRSCFISSFNKFLYHHFKSHACFRSYIQGWDQHVQPGALNEREALLIKKFQFFESWSLQQNYTLEISMRISVLKIIVQEVWLCGREDF